MHLPTLRRQMANAAVCALGGGALGWLFDHGTFGVLLGLVLYLVRQLYYTAALRAWAEHPKRTELPEPRGVWGDIYEILLERYRRNRRRRKRLLGALQQYQASTQALPDGAAVLGAAGELTWFNTAAQALLGLRSPHDLNQRVANLIRHPDFAGFFARGVFDSEVEIPSPVNASCTLSLRVVPYGENQRLLLVKDVSELRRLDRVRRDFVANASHELRTPLTVLRGYLDMMQADAGPAGVLGPWRVPLNEMHAQATRMEALIRDLLRLARLEADGGGARQDVIEVPGLIEHVLADARTLSRGAHRIDAEIEPGACLYGRDSELESIFGNLVANAVQYTPPDGMVRVRWWIDGEGAHFEVADTGIGIPPEDLPRLTERFYRVDEGRSRASGGTGLGLSIVKHALERHEGHLTVESEPGVGSTFACHFPPHRVARQRAASLTPV